MRKVHRGRTAGCGRHRRPRRSALSSLRLTLALGAAGAAALLVAGLASPAPEAERTIRFLEIAQTARGRLVDHNGNGKADPGDSLAATADLFRWAGSRRGAKLGRLLRLCILSSTTGGICAATVFLPDGTVRIQGYVDFDRAPDQLAVVGGTGSYLGMRGSFSSQPLGGRTSTRASDQMRLLR